jgi:elongation factor 2
LPSDPQSLILINRQIFKLNFTTREMPTDKSEERVKKLMHNPDMIRNIAIAAHIDHGKTTFSDNLLAGAGMMSSDLAGDVRALDFHEDERERGITIDAANVSMVHNVDGKDHLINLIDTPGHVDFGGDVTRAMRAVDGCIVLVCASEGIMPQTETVLRQALRERVKPILFINKVDRLIREVKLTPEQMQDRFIGIIAKVNDLIKNIAEEEYGKKWQVNVNEGSVGFGSAYHNWALSVPYMKKHGMTFKDIIEAYESQDEKYKELAKKAPLHHVVLDMVIDHHPSPKVSQKYRIPKIWHGDADSKLGQDLILCNESGEPAFICTKVVIDKNAGEIAAGRLFSGTLRQGDPVYMNQAKKKLNLQQVSIYKGAKRIQLDEVVAGNIVGLVGLKGVYAGETVSVNEIEPFESIKHIFEPVVTKSIEATKASDLPKLVEILRQTAKEYADIKIEINEETGENLMSGMGELHLEVIENRIKTEKGLPIKTGAPIVVYRESVTKPSETVSARTPNGHNMFFFSIEPLEDEIYEAIESGELSEERMKKRAEQTWAKLSELGMSNDEARQVKEIYKGNIFEDRTRGLVLLGEIIDSIMDGWRLIVNAGPLAKEPMMKSKFILHDAKIHVDHMHRGPAQVYPAVRHGLHDAMKKAGEAMLEPLQMHRVEAPVEFMGALTSLVSSKRGELVDVQQDEGSVVIEARIPVAEMIGWSNDLRSATEGRGISSLMDQKFQKMPGDLQPNVIKKIRDRKGLSENQ